MADLLAGVNFAADFRRWAQGTELVTVQSIDAINGLVIAEKAGVQAAKLIRKRATEPARSGSVWVEQDEWWLPVDELGFVLKPVDRIVRASGETFVVNEVNEVAGTIVRCPVTKKR